MYITNRPDVAQIAEASGVDRIFVDMEYIGKDERQKGMDTVQSHHTIDDVKRIAESLSKAELLVRCNPIHNNSKSEIDDIIVSGAKVIMLPYFKTIDEVKYFVKCVNGRCRVSLLVETPEAVDILDEIVLLDGIDEIHFGLNDLHLGYHKKFMFELLSDGTVERLCRKVQARNIPYGFGGIAGLGQGMLPAEKIIKEHYRLGSTMVILSRSFCNVEKVSNIGEIALTFVNGVRALREYEEEVENHIKFFEQNKDEIKAIVEQIVNNK